MPAVLPAFLSFVRLTPRPVLPVAVCLWLLVFIAAHSASATDRPVGPRFAPGEILLRLKPGAAAGVRAAVSPLGRVAARHDLTPLFSRASAAGEDAGGRLARTLRVTLNEGEDVAEMIAVLSGDPDVDYAGPVHLIPVAAPVPSFVPDDPRVAAQWHHDVIGSYAAWDRSAGDSSVVVAIVDTGVDLNHPDLTPNLWVNVAEAGGEPGIDDDGNGYVDDVNGFDFTDVPEIIGAGDFKDRDADPSDDVGHGTWVAGAACAAGDNEIGIAGVAFRSRIMVLRAGFRPRSGFSLGFLAEDDAAAAIVYAVDNGARVLNLSFGDIVHAPILEDAVQYALDHDAVVVAAAGNEGTGLPFYPAAMTGVLAVGASDRDGRRASFSTYGPAVALLAPGAAILTTDLAGDYASKSGTSLAAPLAAGAAALLRALNPLWTGDQVVARILATADEPAVSADARGGRFLRADRALEGGPAAEARFLGLADGDIVDGIVSLTGRAAGPGVRGWRVAVRRSIFEAWQTLFAEPRGPAIDAILGYWDTAAEPEGPAFLRLEALGFDAPLAARETRVTIDHTAPVVTNVKAIPVLSGGGLGLRVEAETDDPSRASVRLDAGGQRLEARSVFFTDHHILGLDGPIPRLGTVADVLLSFTNGAGLATRETLSVALPGPSAGGTTATLEPSPGVRTWMRPILDLNQDGRPDLLAELPPQGGRTYGEVVAFEPSTSVSCSICPVEPLEEVWRSGQEFIPLDAADLDGDGRPEVLGLAFQEVRVYQALENGGYPARLRWQTGEAWGSRFIPADDGSGFEIVATRDTEIRLYGVESEELVLKRTLANPSAGGNSISPAVAAGDLDGDGRLSLLTLDGDGDFLVWTRSAGGVWNLRSETRLAGSFVSSFTIADLDGDGRDEAALVEAVGDVPSPAGGIRDGYYRLVAFRFNDGSPETWLSLGAAGFFPGNPVSLQAFDLDEGGRDALWWGVREDLHRVELKDGALEGTGYWSGVTAGRAAAGRVPKDGRDVSVLYFPGPPNTGAAGVNPDAGRVLAARPELPASAAVTGLRVSESAFARNTVLIRLEWDPSRAGHTVARRDPGQSPHVVYRGAEPFYLDTLTPGVTYTYTVYSGATVDPEEITVLARPDNPVRSAGVAGDAFAIVWENPVHGTERSSLGIEPGDVRSVLHDQGGRRMLIRPESPMEPGRTYRIELVQYVSDSNLPLRGPDAIFEITMPETPDMLRLVAVRPVDPGTVDLVLHPAAPFGILPELLAVEPGVRVRSAVRTGETSVRVTLDPATPLQPGRYTVRLIPGLTGPGGEVVREGLGDALPLQLSPVVFPNPVRSEHRAVRFDWLAEGAYVTVFDIAGHPVWRAASGQGGWVEWNLKATSGRDVAPGAYLFEVEGAFPARGKLAILR